MDLTNNTFPFVLIGGLTFLICLWTTRKIAQTLLIEKAYYVNCCAALLVNLLLVFFFDMLASHFQLYHIMLTVLLLLPLSYQLALATSYWNGIIISIASLLLIGLILFFIAMFYASFIGHDGFTQIKQKVIMHLQYATTETKAFRHIQNERLKKFAQAVNQFCDCDGEKLCIHRRQSTVKMALTVLEAQRNMLSETDKKATKIFVNKYVNCSMGSEGQIEHISAWTDKPVKPSVKLYQEPQPSPPAKHHFLLQGPDQSKAKDNYQSVPISMAHRYLKEQVRISLRHSDKIHEGILQQVNPDKISLQVLYHQGSITILIPIVEIANFEVISSPF